jgi:hypothetical protein
MVVQSSGYDPYIGQHRSNEVETISIGKATPFEEITVPRLTTDHSEGVSRSNTVG